MTVSRRTTSLQALVTGVVLGGLAKVEDHGLALRAEPVLDEDGSYLPQVRVTGLISGEVLLIEIRQVDPE